MILERIGVFTFNVLHGSGRFAQLGRQDISCIFRRPFEWRELIKQFEIVGVQSTASGGDHLFFYRNGICITNL